MEHEQKKFGASGRAHLLLGIVLMLLGVFLIADMVNPFEWGWRLRDYLFTWQALLIFLGVIFISGREGKPAGFILIAVGTFFLLPKMIELPYYWKSLFWPTILIIIGLLVIFGKARPRPEFRHKKKSSSEDFIDDVAVFGGSDRVVSSQNFQGGRLTHVFGGSKYDLTRARLADGVQYIDVTMVFGGTKLIVPEGWDIKLEVTAIFGGFSDKRQKTILVKDPDRSLVIRGITVFGGGEITNYPL